MAQRFGRRDDLWTHAWSHQSVHGSDVAWLFARHKLASGVVGLFAKTGDPIRRKCTLRDGNQGREMAVTVAEFQGLDAPGARLYGIAEGVRTGACQGSLAILFPGPVQCLEPRPREGGPRLVEPFVQVVATRRRGMGAKVLSVVLVSAGDRETHLHGHAARVDSGSGRIPLGRVD